MAYEIAEGSELRLVIRGEKDLVSRDEFEEIVANLAAPYVATG